MSNSEITNIMTKIGYYYEKQNDYDNMKKYYLKAIEKGSYESMHNLGTNYYVQKDYDNMKKYYLMAIEKGFYKSMHNLGLYYYEQKDYTNMNKYFLMAKEKGNNYENIILKQFETAENLLSIRPSKRLRI
jgi:TPR repeat protein